MLPLPFHGTGRADHSPAPPNPSETKSLWPAPSTAPPGRRASLKTPPPALVGGPRGAGGPCQVGRRLGALAAVTLQFLPGEPAPRGRGPTGGPSREGADAGSAAGHPSAPRSPRGSGQNPLTQTSPTYAPSRRSCVPRAEAKQGSRSRAGKLHVPKCTAPRAGAVGPPQAP